MDRSRSEQAAATARCERGRKTLRKGIRHLALVSTVVSPDNAEFAPLDASLVRTDEELIARVENVHRAASAHADLFVKKGIQPGFLDRLANELAAFKKAKDALTRAGKRYTQANERFDHAVADGDVAVGILEGSAVASFKFQVPKYGGHLPSSLVLPHLELDLHLTCARHVHAADRRRRFVPAWSATATR